MIYLFTDFGGGGIYVGQVQAALWRRAPDVPVVSLVTDAPAFNPRAAAHLLAALAGEFLPGDVCLAVVDPGVGGTRRPLVLQADGRWFVGPDNGLLDVCAARAREARAWEILWRPARLSGSFHGRDLFAPVAARLALGEAPAAIGCRPCAIELKDVGGLPEVIYIDGYGNAMTGIPATTLADDARLEVAGHVLRYARVFEAAAPGTAFWYRNSCGLVEIAVNRGSAARALGLEVGMPVRILPDGSEP
ncbi:MAG TPA: SAM-dependent chlorinase/fluorinase [Gammaproteobacteria bacterium]|nr:SAM-dependent chlorinase/fluorinase [Gammaproteobacteria bacterium]